MKKTMITITAASTLFFVSCKNPAGSSTAASVSDAQEVSSEAISGEKWVFNDESKITFTGSKVTGSHSGGFKTISGHFYVDGSSLAASGHQIEIDMTSTYSDDEKLTQHLTSPDFFDVQTYPASTFIVTGLKEEKGPKGESHQLTGNFEFHGVTKSLTIPVVVETTDSHIHIQADFFINRFDFNVEYPGKTDDLIRKEVVIKFDLSASPEKTNP